MFVGHTFLMRLTLILLLFLLFSCKIHSQAINEIVEEIAVYNELESQYVGFDGYHSDQYKRFERLKAELTNDQLLELTNHQNGVVRCYAFWALADRKHDNLFSVLIENLNDTVSVNKLFADIGGNTKVADFYIGLLTQEFINTTHYYRRNLSQITIKEKRVLDSLVIHSSTNLSYLDRLLINYEPDPKLYFRIKELAQQGKLHAFPALARHQNEEDIGLILSLKDIKRSPNMYPDPLEKMFQSVEEFPHMEFMDYLEKFGEEISTQAGWSLTWSYFYRAVAKYKNEHALAILKRPFKSNKPISKYHLRFINNSLGIYTDPVYDSLIIKLWEDHNQIVEGSFNYLKQKNDSLTFNLLESYLEDFEKVYSGADEQLMLPIILPFALEYNKEQAISLIAKNLKTNSITPFLEFYPFVLALQSPEFIDPLLERIENEWNGGVVYLAVEMLTSYKDEQLNEQILARSKRNSKIVNEYSSRKQVEETIREIINGESYYKKHFNGG